MGSQAGDGSDCTVDRLVDARVAWRRHDDEAMHPELGELCSGLARQPPSWRDGDLELAELGGSLDLLGCGAKPGQSTRPHLPASSRTRTSRGRPRRCAGTPRRCDHRPRSGSAAAPAAGVRRPRRTRRSGRGTRVLVVPEVLHRVEELVRDCTSVGEVGADRTELGFEVADADAEDRTGRRRGRRGSRSASPARPGCAAGG